MTICSVYTNLVLEDLESKTTQDYPFIPEGTLRVDLVTDTVRTVTGECLSFICHGTSPDFLLGTWGSVTSFYDSKYLSNTQNLFDRILKNLVGR